MINTLKKLFRWPLIRKQIIFYSHWRTARICRQLINQTDFTDSSLSIKPKLDLGNKKIIWQYWGQGFDNEALPILVRICLDSVKKHCDSNQYILIQLNDNNIYDYIDIPQEVSRNLNLYSRAFYSDFLRCALLSSYGGCWLDATVLLTGPIPNVFWEKDYFLFQRDDSEINKDYWENSFSYYYGWHERFKVRMLSSIIFCHKDNSLFSSLSILMNNFISQAHKLPNYFFFQILFNEFLATTGDNFNTFLNSDCIPHYLQQYVNDESFFIKDLNYILSQSTMHKLTYKCKSDVKRLTEILKLCDMHI